MKDSLEHNPVGGWKFDDSVGECLDNMVERSIPLYAESIDLLSRLAVKHLGNAREATVVDLGCSNGNALAKIIEVIGESGRVGHVRFVGLDCEQHMLDRAAKRLGSSVELVLHNLKASVPYSVGSKRPDVVFLLWTAQFVPLEYRAQLFSSIRSMIAPTGALFVAEKLRGQSSAFQNALAAQYSSWKVRVGGYSEANVIQKNESLENVLVSLSAPEQKQMMMAEGWIVEEVTRYLGFATFYLIPK